jgi:hypothetical protein
VSGERRAGRSAAFERRLANLSPSERADLEFRRNISRLWQRGPRVFGDFLFLFLASYELHSPFAATVEAYLADDHTGPRARAFARNRRAGRRWRQRKRQQTKAQADHPPARGPP